jgi:hypothetical protein
MKFFLRVLSVVALVVSGLSSSGLAAPITYSANLDGLSEAFPNASSATGFITAILDTTLHTLQVNVTFSGLEGGPVTSAHIHAATPSPFTGSAAIAITFIGFPAATSGTYTNPFDLSLPATWSSGFLTNAGGGTAAGAEAALTAALASGRAYANIHNILYPAGEIRGFLAPLPASLLLFGTGLAGLAGIRVRKNRQ